MLQNKEKVNKIFCKIKKSRNNILQSPENRIFLRETFSSLGKLRYFISESLGKVHIALVLENRSVLVFNSLSSYLGEMMVAMQMKSGRENGGGRDKGGRPD